MPADLPTSAPAVHQAHTQAGEFYPAANGGLACYGTTWVDRDAWMDDFDEDRPVCRDSTRNGSVPSGAIS